MLSTQLTCRFLLVASWPAISLSLCAFINEYSVLSWVLDADLKGLFLLLTKSVQENLKK